MKKIQISENSRIFYVYILGIFFGMLSSLIYEISKNYCYLFLTPLIIISYYIFIYVTKTKKEVEVCNGDKEVKQNE